MSSRTIHTPPALRRDTRFQACSPGAKWVFGHLCDRREVVAEPGHDVLGTVVLIVEGLGDTPRDVLAPILAELEHQRGLVTVEADRLVIHTLETAADRPGPRGGKAGSVRMAEHRARKAAEAARVTERTVTVTDSVTSQASPVTVETVTQSVTVTGQSSRDPSPNPSRDGQSDGCDDSIRHVTAVVTGNPSRDGGCDGSVGGFLSPEVPSPHSPLSPTPAPENNKTGVREGAGLDVEKLQRLAALEALEAARVATELKRAEKASKRTARKQAATLDDTIPLAGTDAHALYRAIVNDPALAPIVLKPGDFATRVTNPSAFPGVDVMAVVLDGAEYVARNPGKYSDGRAFLRGALQRARTAPRPGPVVGRSTRAAVASNDADHDDDWVDRAAAEYRRTHPLPAAAGDRP